MCSFWIDFQAHHKCTAFNADKRVKWNRGMSLCYRCLGLILNLHHFKPSNIYSQFNGALMIGFIAIWKSSIKMFLEFKIENISCSLLFRKKLLLDKLTHIKTDFPVANKQRKVLQYTFYDKIIWRNKHERESRRWNNVFCDGNFWCNCSFPGNRTFIKKHKQDSKDEMIHEYEEEVS